MAQEPKLKKPKAGTTTARDRRPAAGAQDERETQDFERSANATERSEQSEAADDNFSQYLNEWLQEPLPRTPDIPGWHTCWLSTTNQYDPIHKRIRMGYQPVKVEEVPGLENYKVHSGEHTGFVAVNEMLLFKIPDALYQRVMTHFHHDMPLQEEASIKERVRQMQEEVKDSTGKSLVTEEEGISELGRPVRAPHFT